METNNPRKKIAIPAIKNWAAPAIMSENLISSLQMIQANVAAAVVQSLASIPRMSVADHIPRMARDMVVDVSGLSRQMQSVAQIANCLSSELEFNRIL